MGSVVAAWALDVAQYPVGAVVAETSAATELFKEARARTVQPWALPTEEEIPPGKEGELIRYGLKLVAHTSETIGPRVPDENLRHSRNDLNCVVCHQEGPTGLPGTKPYGLPFVNVVNDYPKLDPKTMKIASLEMRIAGMLGAGETKIKPDSTEMKAMVAYMTWLGSKSIPGQAMQGTGLDERINLPQRAADAGHGKSLFLAKCAQCHGEQGLGVPQLGFAAGAGYKYPPIAGEDSYDDGGHMYMVPLLTRFLRINMPLGATATAPLLSVEEAYDIAAYVNSALPRKHHPSRSDLYPNPAFRPEGFAIPENYPADDAAAYRRGRFGPFGKHR